MALPAWFANALRNRIGRGQLSLPGALNYDSSGLVHDPSHGPHGHIDVPDISANIHNDAPDLPFNIGANNGHAARTEVTASQRQNLQQRPLQPNAATYGQGIGHATRGHVLTNSGFGLRGDAGAGGGGILYATAAPSPSSRFSRFLQYQDPSASNYSQPHHLANCTGPPLTDPQSNYGVLPSHTRPNSASVPLNRQPDIQLNAYTEAPSEILRRSRGRNTASNPSPQCGQIASGTPHNTRFPEDLGIFLPPAQSHPHFPGDRANVDVAYNPPPEFARSSESHVDASFGVPLLHVNPNLQEYLRAQQQGSSHLADQLGPQSTPTRAQYIQNRGPEVASESYQKLGSRSPQSTPYWDKQDQNLAGIGFGLEVPSNSGSPELPPAATRLEVIVQTGGSPPPEPNNGRRTRRAPAKKAEYKKTAQEGACARCKIHKARRVKTEDGKTSSQCEFPVCAPCVQAFGKHAYLYCIRYRDGHDLLPVNEDILDLITPSPIDLSKLENITHKHISVCFTTNPLAPHVSPTISYRSCSNERMPNFPWIMLPSRLDEFIMANIHVHLQLPDSLKLKLNDDERALIKEFHLCAGYYVLLSVYSQTQYRVEIKHDDLLPAQQISMDILKLILTEYSRRFKNLMDSSYVWVQAPKNGKSMVGPTYVLSGLYRLNRMQSEIVMPNSLHALSVELRSRADSTSPKMKVLAESAMRKMKGRERKGEPSFEGFSTQILPSIPEPVIYLTHTFVPDENMPYLNPSNMFVQLNPFEKSLSIALSNLVRYYDGMDLKNLINPAIDDSASSEASLPAYTVASSHIAKKVGLSYTLMQPGDPELDGKNIGVLSPRLRAAARPLSWADDPLALLFDFDSACKSSDGSGSESGAFSTPTALSNRRPRSRGSTSGSGRSRPRRRLV